jgi:hypothetical protein
VTKQKLGWGLLLDDGMLLCREDFATLSKSAIEKSGQIEVAGVSQATFEPIESLPLSDGSKVLGIRLTAQPSISEPLLDSREFLKPIDSAPQDLLIIGSETDRSILVDSNRFEKNDRGLRLEDAIELPDELDGAFVVDVQQGRWLGVLRRESRGWLIALRAPLQ